MSAQILLVEDNPITRKMVRFALESQGFGVIEAPDGAAALGAFRDNPIALVLQDIVLPDIDGFELVQALRALPGGADVPILAVSGLMSKLEEARVSAVGFDDVIAKPVEPSRLLQIVRAHLPAARPERPPAGRSRQLLVVDDDPVQRKLVCFRLQRAGYAVQAATDGAEALELARRARPDAIVSDVLMPRLDGFGLCVAVQRDPALAGVPVILVTNSYVESEDRELARRAGASDLVLRTPELGEVLGALSSLLSGAQKAPAAPARDPDLEADRMRRVLRQLERQVALYAGASQRAALLSAELSVLSGISEALATEDDIDEALRMVLAACFDAGGISVGALYLTGPGGRRLIRLGSGHNLGDEELVPLLDQVAHLEHAGQAQSVLVVPSDAVPDRLGARLLALTGSDSALLAPLSHQGELLGVLFMASPSIELLADDRVVFAQGVAGQISQALALTRAFGEKDASEREARHHATVLDSVLESIADGVVVADERGRLIVWNAAAEAILGPRPAGDDPDGWLREKPLLKGDRVTPYAGDELPLVRAMRGESVDRAEVFIRDGKDGGDQWLEVNARPLRDEQSRLSGGVAVFRDVTAERAAQTQLMVSDRMASVGMLAAGVAHEINNPLAAVMANLDLAARDLADLDDRLAGAADLGELREEIGDARQAAQRVRQIVRDLRIFSRAEEDLRSAVDVERVLESTLRMAWNEIRHRARLVKEYQRIPPVDGNESRLGQVFLNLVINAAQAIPEGHADRNEIRIRTARLGDRRVQVEIADTGSGMPPEVLARLFTPFFTTKPPGVGTGLGLTICQRLIAAIGGQITVSSAVGRGTVFRVILPRAAEDRPQQPSQTFAPARARRRARVLVIDDEAMIGLAVSRALGAEHEVTSLTSASEAASRIAAGERYDLILCDLMMPVMTGMDLHGALLASAPDQARRMVFLTGGAFTPAARAFLDRVPNARLEKPFDVQNLRALVNDRLG
ncbi:MAG TPA: response regulator [Kofleriaceae bacterium]|nr:response regulator [Kofleriaceae bacterium]